MKPWYVHYLNKYPGGRTIFSDTEVLAFDANGEMRVRITKNGAGMWADSSEELGLKDRHDLAPIPRDTRVWKLGRDGIVSKDELADERIVVAALLANHFGGRVPGAFEIHQAAGLPCDPRDQKLIAWECAKDERFRAKAPKMLEPPKSEGRLIEDKPPIPAESRRLDAEKS